MVKIKIKDDYMSIKYVTSFFNLTFHIGQKEDIKTLKTFLVNTKNDSGKKKLSFTSDASIEKKYKFPIEENKSNDNNEEYSEQLDLRKFPMIEKKEKLINFPKKILKQEDSKDASEDNYVLINSVKGNVRSIGVQQFVIKEHNGAKVVFLRSTYSEIIDFLTTYSLKRRFEKTLKSKIMKEPSVEEPTRYAERYMKFMKSIFCVDEISI